MLARLALSAIVLQLPVGLAQEASLSSDFGASQIVTPRPTTHLDGTSASQAPLPPLKQSWCPSDIFCAGPLLQAINLAHLYDDDKVFVDKPTIKRSQQVLEDFNNIVNDTTIGQIATFVNSDFQGEGLELEKLTLSNFNQAPAFLSNVTNGIMKAWIHTVHGYWTQLIRGTNLTAVCAQGPGGSCESSLIPLNHTFVVPGGRFREQYYWDSFWIVEGLIESELFEVVNATLQNFMDQLERYGYIPNGGRIYYLNRSQPPLFIQMLSRYVITSGDTKILERALPLAEKELAWWDNSRSINVTSPFTGESYKVHRHAVTNSAPRPESYRTDYMLAAGPDIEVPLDESQKANLYAELASGAESGWDYSVRWLSKGGKDGLRSLDVRNTIPVDLNSIIYRNHVLMASLYGSNRTAADQHLMAGQRLRKGIIDLFWDPKKLAFYDFNLAENARNTIFTAASFYPLWSGIIPDEILSGPEKAFGFFSSLNMVLNRYNGSFPATFIDSGFQWDSPNAWPPHQYIALQALRALPANVSDSPLPLPGPGQSSYSLIPPGQLGIDESGLPGQPIRASDLGPRNATSSGPDADINRLNGTVSYGGEATVGEGWSHTLQRELANRYIANAFCSWLATGGSIPGIVPRLSDAELNVTKTIGNTDGNMFEKFSNIDIDSAGRGGEYTVQAGFGWTNGVALWIASNYGNVLVPPQCPNLLETPLSSDGLRKGLVSLHWIIAIATLASLSL